MIHIYSNSSFRNSLLPQFAVTLLTISKVAMMIGHRATQLIQVCVDLIILMNTSD